MAVRSHRVRVIHMRMLTHRKKSGFGFLLRFLLSCLVGISLSEADGRASTALQWKVSPGGAISNAAAVELKSTTVVLAATQPDVDVLPKITAPQLVWIEGGKVRWRSTLNLPAKSVALSQSGELGVIATYHDEVLLFNRKGKLLWKKEGACRPEFLDSYSLIACTHDDDTDPRIAFDLFDLGGNKVYSHPIESDLLDFKVSADQKFILLSLTGARVELIALDQLTSTLAKSKAPPARSLYVKMISLATDAGEVALFSSPQVLGDSKSNSKEDLWSSVLIAVASGPRQAAVLQLIRGDGELGAAVKLSDIAVELLFGPRGDVLVVHFHSTRGQSYASFEVPGLSPQGPSTGFVAGAFSVLTSSSPSGITGAAPGAGAGNSSFEIIRVRNEKSRGDKVTSPSVVTLSILPPEPDALLSQIIPNKTGSSMVVVWDNGEIHQISLNK